MIRWSLATELIFYMGVLGQAAYLSDPSKRIMGVWVFVALVMVSFVVLLFFRHGEFSDETVARAHLVAALWYLALTLIAVVLAAGGYRPHGWVLFLLMIAPGACISLWCVRESLRDPPSPSLPAR